MIIKTPGKLFLSGEWSILVPNNTCIVLPINKFLTTQIQANKNIVVTLQDFDLKNIELEFTNNKLQLKTILSKEKNKIDRCRGLFFKR